MYNIITINHLIIIMIDNDILLDWNLLDSLSWY